MRYTLFMYIKTDIGIVISRDKNCNSQALTTVAFNADELNTVKYVCLSAQSSVY